MKKLLVKFAKHLQFISPLRKYFFYRYSYMFTPAQLWFLCQGIEDTAFVAGDIVEIGCANGNTTVFLNKHMDCLGLSKTYICIDTFQGFTQSDVAMEVECRGKCKKHYKDSFSVNKKKWFDATMKMNAISRVRSIESDICAFDFNTLGKVSFCLLDVDLYRPTKFALEGIIPHMNKGGMVVVDDCVERNRYDGALQAVKEVAASGKLTFSLHHEKLAKILF